MHHIITALALLTIPLTFIAGLLAYHLRRAERQATERAEAYNTMKSVCERWHDKWVKADTLLREEVRARNLTTDRLKIAEAELREVGKQFEAAQSRLAKFDRPRDPKTGRIVSSKPKPKPHQLKHGMTVKDPTEEEAKEIFEAARKAGYWMVDTVP